MDFFLKYKKSYAIIRYGYDPVTCALRRRTDRGIREVRHMAKGRYIKDYRIVESLNGRGGIRLETEYIGDPYVFACGAEKAGKSRRLCVLLCLAAWLLFVGALPPNSAGMRTIYVSLPFAFTALPLGLLSSLLLSALRLKEPMEHRMADRFENRFPAQALAITVLPGVSLAGEGLMLLLGKPMLPGDGIFAPCAAGLFACGLVLFLQRKALRTRKG